MMKVWEYLKKKYFFIILSASIDRLFLFSRNYFRIDESFFFCLPILKQEVNMWILHIILRSRLWKVFPCLKTEKYLTSERRVVGTKSAYFYFVEIMFELSLDQANVFASVNTLSLLCRQLTNDWQVRVGPKCTRICFHLD